MLLLQLFRPEHLVIEQLSQLAQAPVQVLDLQARPPLLARRPGQDQYAKAKRKQSCDPGHSFGQKQPIVEQKLMH